MMTEREVFWALRVCLKQQPDEQNTEIKQELVKSDDAAIGLSEGEQALLNSSQRAPYNDVVPASLDDPAPESSPDFSWETGSESQVRDPEDLEKKKVPSPDSSAPTAVRPSNVMKVARRQAWRRGLRGPGRQRGWRRARRLNLSRMILSMRDKILESFESLEARYQQMEGMLLHFLHGQHKIQEHLEQLLGRLNSEASLDHLELRLDTLDAHMFALLGAMERPAPTFIPGSP